MREERTYEIIQNLCLRVAVVTAVGTLQLRARAIETQTANVHRVYEY
jgi:hypothetical protein